MIRLVDRRTESCLHACVHSGIMAPVHHKPVFEEIVNRDYQQCWYYQSTTIAISRFLAGIYLPDRYIRTFKRASKKHHQTRSVDICGLAGNLLYPSCSGVVNGDIHDR